MAMACPAAIASGTWPPASAYLILAYRPFDEAQPYAEVGPIFLHAEPCERYPVTGETPAMFLQRERYLLKGYHPERPHLLRQRPDRAVGRNRGGGGRHPGAARCGLCPCPFGAEQLLSMPDRTGLTVLNPG